MLEEETGTRGHVAGMEQMINACITSAGNPQEAKRKFCAWTGANYRETVCEAGNWENWLGL